MFYYSDTNKLSKPSELMRKVVTEIRKVTYLNDSPNPTVSEPVVTYGYETVKEVAVSPEWYGEPTVVEEKTIDNRNPNRIVKRVEEERDNGN